MGSTTNLALPYPEGTDFVIDGDDAIQALAEAADADSVQWAKLAQSGTQNFLDSNPEAVEWTPGSCELTADFELDPSNLAVKYTGRPRFLAWRYGIKLPANGGTGAFGLFRYSGTATAGTDKYVHKAFPSTTSSAFPLTDSGLVWADTDTLWQVILEQSTGATRACQAWASFKAI